MIGGVGRVTAAGIVVALCVGAFLAPFASQLPDGLDAVAEKHGFSELGHSAWALFSDYKNMLPSENWQTPVGLTGGSRGDAVGLPPGNCIGTGGEPDVPAGRGGP